MCFVDVLLWDFFLRGFWRKMKTAMCRQRSRQSRLDKAASGQTPAIARSLRSSASVPLDRGVRGVDNPKPVKAKMRVERQRGWDVTATAWARRLRPLGRGAPLSYVHPKTLNPNKAFYAERFQF